LLWVSLLVGAAVVWLWLVSCLVDSLVYFFSACFTLTISHSHGALRGTRVPKMYWIAFNYLSKLTKL
jgi:hypothetical protein